MFAWPLPPLTMIRGSVKSRYLSSQFGPRTNPVTGAAQNHGGIDLPADVGTPVTMIAGGRVDKTVLDHPVAGHYVDVDHGNGYWSRYLHLSRIDVKPGQTLAVGGQVGLSGGGKGIPGAGRTTGPHLHLEVWQGKPYAGGKPVDPEPLLTVELADLAKAAVATGRRAVATGTRAAKRGAAALRRNWWIAGIGLAVFGGAAWLILTSSPSRTPAIPAKNPRRRRRR
jgi:murein DD-endopeptidase